MRANRSLALQPNGTPEERAIFESEVALRYLAADNEILKEVEGMPWTDWVMDLRADGRFAYGLQDMATHEWTTKAGALWRGDWVERDGRVELRTSQAGVGVGKQLAKVAPLKCDLSAGHLFVPGAESPVGRCFEFERAPVDD
jgi:hypothetical protein